MTGYAPSSGPVLPEWGARVALCPEQEPNGNRVVYRIRVMPGTTKIAKE